MANGTLRAAKSSEFPAWGGLYQLFGPGEVCFEVFLSRRGEVATVRAL